MRRECYRCHVSLGPDIPDPPGWDRARHGEPITSGLCEECLEAESARLARETAETTDPGDNPGNW